MTDIIDGKAMAAKLRENLAEQVQALSYQPGLAVILVGENPASQVYVRNKIKACEKVGIRSIEILLPASSTDEDIALIIEQLNEDKSIDGILLQLPLPKHLNSDRLVQLIAAEKDVDGLSFVNIGALVAGSSDGIVPCTPQGAMLLLKSVLDNLSGLNAVVIGRSLLFGKPMAHLLLQKNCTVTMAHSRTRDLQDLCSRADIIVAAVGVEKLVKGDWIKQGAVIIDVGINRMENGKLCGDVDFDAAQGIASAITPVPGGVGPMTIACLIANTLRAANNLRG
jgi:methylenetetrahydrofolate dehydrogenase (NADP+)/methenyltetrahydrofolate cyclohydrolase